MTLPGEGKDRVFRVAIKWMAQVSLFALEEALEGRTRQIPYDAIMVCRGIESLWKYYISRRPFISLICSSGFRCSDEAFTFHDVYTSRTIFFLES